MSKSQATQLGAALRKLSGPGTALVQIGYQPSRGIVVEVIRKEGGRSVEELAVISPEPEDDAKLFE